MKLQYETLHGPHAEIIQEKLDALSKRIDELEEENAGFRIAFRSLAHRGSELVQDFENSDFATDREHIEKILWAIKTCYEL